MVHDQILGTDRASFLFYNTKDETAIFAKAIAKLIKRINQK
jgi:selenocysteine lyase/cysteine desulfurase